MAHDYKALDCLHCRRQLALATPTRLLFNQGSYCESKVTLRCSTCGAQRCWQPLRVLDKNDTLIGEMQRSAA